MTEPIFIKIVDYSKNEWFINIKHIFEITDEVRRKEKITSISYYSTPIPENSDVTIIKTPENKESIIKRIEDLKKS